MTPKSAPIHEPQVSRCRDAIDLIRRTVGYSAVADDLEGWFAAGNVRYDPDLSDRAQVSVLGFLILGPEPFEPPLLGLAETLVHEHHHRFRQHHFEKTVSVWAGLATRTPIMARYERCAWRAALRFVQEVRNQQLCDPAECDSEEHAIRTTWDIHYRIPLEHGRSAWNGPV